MTEKQLVEQIKSLKDIKPRKEWVVLLKSQILTEKQAEISVVKQPVAKSVGILNIFSSLFLQRKLAYSFAVALFMIVGIFGFAQYTMPGDLLFPVKKIAEQSQAALTGQTGLRQNMAVLNSRINDLAQIAKEGRKDNIPSAISEVNANALELAKDLKSNPVSDQQTLKAIDQTLNKTFADMPGTDLTESSGVKDLLQAVITNYKTITLTDDQKKTLADAQDLYDQGKYTDALEEILLINN